MALWSLICPFCFSSFNIVEESLKSQVIRESNDLAFHFPEQHCLWNDFSFSIWYDLQSSEEINVFLFIYAFSRRNLKSRVNVCWWNGRVTVMLTCSWTDENWVQHSWKWGSYWWPGGRDWYLHGLNSKIYDLHLRNSAVSFIWNSNEGSAINVKCRKSLMLCTQCVLSKAVSRLYFHLLYFLIPIYSLSL